MTKAKCVFKNKEAPQTIMVRLWSIEAPLREYHLRGKGVYPYDCPSKRKYPDSYVYISETDGWIASHDLEVQDDGNYISK